MPGTIGVGDVVLYTFATPVDISLIGDHTLNAWTGLPADTINDNDTTYSTLANIPVITTYPYYENWELGDEDGWMASGYRDWETDRKSTRLNSSHRSLSRMPSSA